jgi:hypothetical protein
MAEAEAEAEAERTLTLTLTLIRVDLKTFYSRIRIIKFLFVSLRPDFKNQIEYTKYIVR